MNNRGEIKSLIKNIRYNKLINGAVNDGYRYVWLYKDKKASKCAVHQIVAKAFIPNPNGYKQINHKDENPLNNNVENLEWCSAKYNINYGTRNDKIKQIQKGQSFHTKLTKEDREFIKNSTLGRRPLAKKFGVCQKTISNIRNNYYKYD
ncbi:MAG: HNH endonuclease [Bacilli bacterium]|nr:HNH endonuclease [Bacilli bacterium]